MTETELKFQVPVERRAAVRRAVATSTARTTRLQARYFDTPERRLAAAGFALRLRKEGRRWVQTLKGRGDGLMQRLEHEVALPAAAGVPQLDVARHAGTPAGEALAGVLGDDAAALSALFATDVRRTHRVLRSGGALIEIAFDEGAIFAGETRAPLCELEFELVRGRDAALLDLAARWAERHGLWLDVRSKAERGDLLARGEVAAPAVHGEAPVIEPAAAPAQALAAMVGVCLAQVLPNAAAVAAGGWEPEHVHQLRVGLRRLRTALRVFGAWAPAPLDPAWEPGLAQAFAALGASRDRDALADSLLPSLEAAGAPALGLPDEGGESDTGSVLREPAFNRLMLAMIGAAATPPTQPQGEALAEAAGAIVKRQHRKLVRGAEGFAALATEEQHRVRKRLKRLRYSAEFVGSLFPHKRVERYLAALRPVQNALGEYNDVLVAEAAFQRQVEADPRAWFALGWLAGERERRLARAAKAVAKLADAPAFWK